jgi:hypothetical protein
MATLVAFADHAGDRRRRRRARRSLSLCFLAIVLLGAFVMIMPLAHAHTPDPTWIPGIYDEADYDDISALLTETSLAGAPHAILIGPPSVVAPSGPGYLAPALKIDACLMRRPRAPPIASTKSTFRVTREGPPLPVRSSPCGIKPGRALSHFTYVAPNRTIQVTAAARDDRDSFRKPLQQRRSQL